MSASVTATGADPSRRFSSRYQVGLGQPDLSHGALGQDTAGLHAGLFEQILSLPVPIESSFPENAGGWSGQPQETQTTNQSEASEGQDELPSDEEPANDGDDDLAAAIVAIDQQAEVIQLTGEPAPESKETILETPEVKHLESEQSKQAVDQPIDDAVDISKADLSVDDTDRLDVDEGIVKQQHADDAAPSGGDELLQASIAGAQEVAQQASRARAELSEDAETEASQEELRLADNADESEVRDETHDDDANVELLAAEERSEDSGNRRDARDRREKWFERDASDQANAISDPAQETNATKNTVEAVNILAEGDSPEPTQPVNTELPKTGNEFPTEPTLPTEVPTTSNITVSQEAAAPQSGLSASNSSGTERSSSAVSGLERAAERPGAPPVQAGKKSNVPGDSVDLTQQERVRLVQRVARSFARIGPEGGQINLRLHPPQLGSLNVQVRLEGRSMTANLTTESGAAREVILESLPVLRSRLAEQGFEISQFQVDVAANGSDASQGGNGDQQTLDQEARDRESQIDYRRFSRSPSRTHEGEGLPTTPREDSLVWQAYTGIDVHA